MAKRGFAIRSGVHPIVPIMLYDAKLAQDIAAHPAISGRYLRDWVQLPCGPERTGPHPGSDFGGAHKGPPRYGNKCLRDGGEAAWGGEIAPDARVFLKGCLMSHERFSSFF
jgi:hypothetical protein